MNTEEFIKKAVNIHGKIYNYSKVNYTLSKKQIEIICLKHGVFSQRPDKHLDGQGCCMCFRDRARLTTKKFIGKAIKIHGNRYDYSKIDYQGALNKVEIVCKEHGSFWQTASTHLNGSGCNKCAGRQVFSLKDFLTAAYKVHKEKYNYSKVIYKNNHTKIEIICSLHGTFFQSPANHLTGSGCPSCSNLRRLTTQEFIQKAKLTHGSKYEYLHSVFINTYSKLVIVCSFHGVFHQRAGNHLKGQGCPKCTHLISKPETQWLDELGVPIKLRQYKIKISNIRFNVDGYNPRTNTVYEFFGDYWHGNPKRFNESEMNTRAHKTFGELYKETINRIKLFESNGYNVKYIWESDYRK